MRKLVGCIGAIVCLFLFVVGFLAYFVTYADPVTGIWYDGVGRQLSQAPLIARFILGQERLWAGWEWFAFDLAAFWGVVGLGSIIANYVFDEQPRNQ